MAFSKPIYVGDKEVTVRELSVREIREWMKAAETDSSSMLDLGDVLFEDVRIADLAVMSDASAEDLEAMSPSDLRAIADTCREVNEHFFAMSDRINPVLSEALEKIQSASSKGS